MFGTLLAKEFLEALYSLKFHLAVLILGLLAVGGTALLVERHDDFIADQGEGLSELQRMSEKYGSRKSWGIDLPLPPRALEGVFTGTRDEKDGNMFLHVQHPVDFRKSLGSLTAAHLFPPVDLTFVVTVVVTLLALLMAHDLVTREKERGTLKLLLSNSVPRPTVVLAKWSGNCLMLAAAVSFLFLIAAIVLAVMPTNFSMSGQWGRLFMIYCVALLLAGVFFGFGLMFSALNHSSRNALVLLLFCWVVFVYVIPDISPYLAGSLRPAPSVQEILRAKRQISLDWEQERSDRMRSVHVFDGEDAGEIMRETYADLSRSKVELSRRLDREYRTRLNAQILLSRALSYLSPVAVGTYLVTDLAGTGVTAHMNLGDAIEEYWERFREDWFFIETMEDLPEFEEPAVGWREALVLNRAGLILLVVLNIVFFAGAYVSFLGYDVR